MKMKFYIDTSVWGGYFDKEFSESTIPFIEQIIEGRIHAIVSSITLDEISHAPIFVQDLLKNIPEKNLEIVFLTEEHEKLAKNYIKEGVLTKKYESDALHISIASILKVDSLVSWNFKHMVNFFRIKQYNAINLLNGYSLIDIRTPKEIIYERK